MRGFESSHVCHKGFVIGLDVIDETLQLCGSIAGEDWGFVKRYETVSKISEGGTENVVTTHEEP